MEKLIYIRLMGMMMSPQSYKSDQFEELLVKYLNTTSHEKAISEILHWSIRTSQDNIVDLILNHQKLRHRLSIITNLGHSKDVCSNTLHTAIRSRNFQFLNSLLDSGANVWCKATNGLCPIEILLNQLHNEAIDQSMLNLAHETLKTLLLNMKIDYETYMEKILEIYQKVLILKFENIISMFDDVAIMFDWKTYYDLLTVNIAHISHTIVDYLIKMIVKRLGHVPAESDVDWIKFQSPKSPLDLLLEQNYPSGFIANWMQQGLFQLSN